MREAGRVELPVPDARALLWQAGDLYDVAAGWRHFRLDGSAPSVRFTPYGPGFDAVVASPDGELVALVESTGTKALLLRPDGRVVREVNRSYYHADAYRYPLALFTLPDGRTGLAHCPEEYNRLEIEDALTGAPLTNAEGRKPVDLFHSRLAVSTGGRHLLSAGWVWHPWSCVAVYDVGAALDDAAVLDSWGDVWDLRGIVQAEVSGACFVDDDVVVSTSPEENDPDDADDLGPNMLARRSTADRRFVWRRQLDHSPGDLLPMAGGVLSLNGYPRLYDAATGDLVHAWPDLATGEADSSIVWGRAFSGPARIAIDEPNHRFAVTDGERITVVSWAAE